MNKQELMDLFPIKGYLTQEIIDKADIGNTANCRGALTLKAALGDNLKYFKQDSMWGAITGTVSVISGGEFDITTKEGINFMTTNEPQDVLFYVCNGDDV